MPLKIFFGGGINEQQSPNINEAYTGSYNFELSKNTNALIPRKPFDLKGTATNAGDIRGILQLVKRNDSQTTLVQAGNVLYEWDGAAVFTSRGSPNANSQLRDCYWSLDDYLVVTDLQKLTPVSKWDGTTFSTLTSGLGSTLYAKYAIVHNSRMWLFNVTAGTDTPHLMVASEFETPTSYDNTKRSGDETFTTGLEAFYMTTPDLRPINGVAKTLAGDLIISTLNGQLFKLTGFDSTTYQFVDFFPGSEAVGNESIASIGNDLIYMRRHGSIDLLSATQAYGDVSADDISRWIEQTVAGLEGAIIAYDQNNQKVFFFVENKVLVLFKDIMYGGAPIIDKGERAKLSPWSIYKTNDQGSFNTNAARYLRKPGTSEYSVYFGGTDGRIFDINGEGIEGDAGVEDITVVRRTRHITEDDGVRFMRRAGIHGRLQYRRLNIVPFNISADWADEFNQSDATVILKGGITDLAAYYGGPYYYFGPWYYGPAFAGGDGVSHINFSNVGKAPGCFLTFSTHQTLTYQVDWVEI